MAQTEKIFRDILCEGRALPAETTDPAGARTIDDLRKQVSKLKWELEAEKQKVRQLHRDHETELKRQREEHARKLETSVESASFLKDQEKLAEIKRVEERLLRQNDHELKTLEREKNEEMRRVQRRIEHEKDDSLRIALEVERKRIYSEFQEMFQEDEMAARDAKLKKEVFVLGEQNERLEEQVRNLTRENRSQIELLRRMKHEHEAEIGSLMKKHQSEASRDMAQLQLAERMLMERDQDLHTVEYRADMMLLEKEAIAEELAHVKSVQNVGSTSQLDTTGGTLRTTPRSQPGGPGGLLQKRVEELDALVKKLEEERSELKHENASLRKKRTHEGDGEAKGSKQVDEKLKKVRKRNADLVALAKQLDEKCKSLRIENEQLQKHTVTPADAEQQLRKTLSRHHAKDIMEYTRQIHAKDKEIDGLKKRIAKLLLEAGGRSHEASPELEKKMRAMAMEKLRMEKIVTRLYAKLPDAPDEVEGVSRSELERARQLTEDNQVLRRQLEELRSSQREEVDQPGSGEVGSVSIQKQGEQVAMSSSETVEALRKENKSLVGENDSLKTQVKQLTQFETEATSLKASLESTLRDLEEVQSSSQHRVRQLTQQLETAKVAIQELEGAQDHCSELEREVAEVRGALNTKDTEICQLELECRNVTTSLQEREQDLETTKRQVLHLESVVSEKERQCRELQVAVEELQSKSVPRPRVAEVGLQTDEPLEFHRAEVLSVRHHRPVSGGRRFRGERVKSPVHRLRISSPRTSLSGGDLDLSLENEMRAAGYEIDDSFDSSEGVGFSETTLDDPCRDSTHSLESFKSDMLGKEEERARKEEERARKEEERPSKEEDIAGKEEERARKEEDTAGKEEERARKEDIAGKEEERARKEEERTRKEEDTAGKEEERTSKEEERASKEEDIAGKEEERTRKGEQIAEMEEESVWKEEERMRNFVREPQHVTEPEATSKVHEHVESGRESPFEVQTLSEHITEKPVKEGGGISRTNPPVLNLEELGDEDEEDSSDCEITSTTSSESDLPALRKRGSHFENSTDLPVEAAQDGEHFVDENVTPKVSIFIARFTYKPAEMSPNPNYDQELSVSAGDYLYVFGDIDEDGFYHGQLPSGQTGLIPSNFIERVMDESEVSMQPPRKGLRRRRLSNLQDIEEEDEEVSSGDSILPPQTLELERQFVEGTDYSVVIQWEPPHPLPAETSGYNVYVNGELKAPVYGADERKVILSGIPRHQLVKISVRTVTEEGESPDPAKLIIINPHYPEPPTNIEISQTENLRAILVQWTPAPPLSVEGGTTITGYAVYLNNQRCVQLAANETPTESVCAQLLPGDLKRLDFVQQQQGVSLTVRALAGVYESADSCSVVISKEMLTLVLEGGEDGRMFPQEEEESHSSGMSSRSEEEESESSRCSFSSSEEEDKELFSPARRVPLKGSGDASVRKALKGSRNASARRAPKRSRNVFSKDEDENVIQHNVFLDEDEDENVMQDAEHVTEHEEHMAQPENPVPQETDHVTQHEDHLAQNEDHVTQDADHVGQDESHVTQHEDHATKDDHVVNGANFLEMIADESDGEGRTAGPPHYYRALFNYNPLYQSPNNETADEELFFWEGDIILAKSEMDEDGFFEGDICGQVGFVPGNMVEEITSPEELAQLPELLAAQAERRKEQKVPTMNGGQTPTPPPGQIIVRLMRALGDYNPSTDSPNSTADEELSFKEGDVLTVYGKCDKDGYREAELGGKRGYVPCNFLEEIQPDQLQEKDGGGMEWEQEGGQILAADEESTRQAEQVTDKAVDSVSRVESPNRTASPKHNILSQGKGLFSKGLGKRK